MAGRQKYFEEALSDFMHDTASGAAIRHLVDLGYSLDQIMQSLSYPTPREKVQKTAYRYMLESGLVRRTLPGMEDDVAGVAEEWPRGFTAVRLQIRDRAGLYQYLQEKIMQNGEENSYFSCPFGMLIRQEEAAVREEKIRERLACLNRREQDYILGIPWERRMMYHRLNDRMREIGRKLIVRPQPGCRYCFLRTGEIAAAGQEPDMAL